MGNAPTEVMIAATDVAATIAFLNVHGFVEVARDDVPGGVFGRSGTVGSVTMRQPGTAIGGFLIMDSDRPVHRRGHFDHGGIAVDVYTRDADATRARAVAAGQDCREVELIEMGPISMRQLHITAPDGWSLVFVESDRRRPSLLDHDQKAQHSEVHSVIWGVEKIEDATPGWEAQGLAQHHLFPIALPAVCRVMGLPSEDIGLRMNLLADDEQSPIRVELMDFPGLPGAAAPVDPLTPGIVGLVFGAEPGNRALFRG